ncbi:MAG: ATP-binding protein [Myxococcota bacterium]|nr:HAMP domain-containing protein [Myxococcales bacterium]
MARERSLGTRWAIRYALATFVVVAGVLSFHYVQTRERFQRDAQLLLRLQANELVGEIQRDGADVERLERYIDRTAALGYRVLRLGFRVLDPDGAIVVERGSLENSPIPLPSVLPKAGDPEVVEEVDTGETFPFYTLVVRAPAGGWVQVAVDTKLFARSAREIRNLFVVSLPIVALLTGAIGVALARSSLRPIARIIAGVEEVSATQLTRHVVRTGTGDELDRLASAFNAMTDRIRAGVDRMRRFSADAAHELRTPVTLMRNRIEAAADAPRDAERDQALLERTLEDIDHLSSTIRAMLRLAHSEAGVEFERLRRVSLRELAEGVVEFFEPLALDAEVSLALAAPDDVVVVGDPTWLHQLFANLVDNAIKFTPAGGSVVVSIAQQGAQAVADVSDTGIGIPAHERERVFEAFRRVDGSASRTGSGLGLPLAREIARAHGGEIELESEVGRGSVLRVRLPVGGPGASAARGRAHTAERVSP